MEWLDSFGNKYKIKWLPWKVKVLRFESPYWVEDGKCFGSVVSVKTWHGDHFYVRPENLLFTRNDIENRDKNIIETMRKHVEYEDCGCGCESKKPKDSWSTAWLRASYVVACEPVQSPTINANAKE